MKYFSGGNGFFAFTGRETGNVLFAVGEQSNRWTSSEISGDSSTEILMPGFQGFLMVVMQTQSQFNLLVE